MNLDDLRKKARGGDLEPEPDKPCDFEGCENFATYKDEEGKWCHTHRMKMIRETVSRGVNDFGGSAVTAIGFTGFSIATCAISPSAAFPSSSGPAMPPIPPSIALHKSTKSKIRVKDKEKKSKTKKAIEIVKSFSKGVIEGLKEDESKRTKK